MTRALGSLALTCALFMAVSPALAQRGPASRHLKTRHDQVTALLRNSSAQRAEGRISQMIDGLLDFDTVSQRALTDHWERLSPAQRTEFVSLLKRLVQRNYEGNLRRTLDFTVRYSGEQPRGEQVVVQTLARSRANRRAPEVSIDYTMARRGSAWVVHDVTTDGVSMVRNYRNQFNRIIQREGFDALLARMRQRLASGSEL